MKRFLKFALLLGAANLLATVTAIVIFRHLDLRFSVFLELLLIPAAQAAALIWLAPSGERGEWSLAARSLSSRPILLALLIADLAIFVVASLQDLPGLWTTHGLVAAAFTFAVARKSRRADAAWLYAFALGLALFALSYTTGWLSALPLLFGRGRTVIRWFVAYAPLFVIAVVTMLRIGRILSFSSPVAGRMVDAAVGCALCAALLVVSNIFFHPFLVEPWRSIEKLLSWLVMTGFVLAPASALLSREASNEAS